MLNLKTTANHNNDDNNNKCRQYFDVELPSTLWSDCVRRFEKKFAECDNSFLQNFNFNLIAYIYLLVKFLFCPFFCFFHVYLLPLPVMVNKDVYNINKSSQKPHSSTKENLVWIRSPYPNPDLGSGLLPKFNGELLDQGYMRDKI